MTVNESKGLKKDARIYWRGDAADSGVSPKQVGLQSRSPGTMGRWPVRTTGTCAKFSEWRSVRLAHTVPMTSGMSRRRRRGHGYCWQNGLRFDHTFRARLRRDESLRGRRRLRHSRPCIRVRRIKVRIQCKEGRDQNRSHRSEIRQNQHREASSTSEASIVYRIGSPVRIDDSDMFIRFRLFRRACSGVRSIDVRIWDSPRHMHGNVPITFCADIGHRLDLAR
jgi:hypothetical protein